MPEARVNNLGKVIMTRVLERGRPTVLVEIGRPMPFADGGSGGHVPFRVGDGRVLQAGGVDGVQAMLFALAIIGDLARSDGLTFLGTQAFPTTVREEGVFVSVYRLRGREPAGGADVTTQDHDGPGRTGDRSATSLAAHGDRRRR